jgi:hypothetical protein
MTKIAQETTPVALLQTLQDGEKTWEKLAPRYGVTAPDPPWKVSLYATCECLAAQSVVPALERRDAEDYLGEKVYNGALAAGPEQQLVALAHIMLQRGLLTEEELAQRMQMVRARLESE